MSTADPMIEIRGLSKRFGGVDALRGLDLRVPPGCIYGFLGRNGAGKTTTIKALMGMVRPDAGDARVLGLRADDDREGTAIRRRVGHVGEDRSAWPGLTVEQVLAISRPMFPAWRVDVEHRYLESFDIPVRRRMGSLSKGMRTAIAIVLALSRDPDVLLLDEPTEGLDPSMNERVLQALMATAAARPDVTLFFSSHRLTEVEQIADRIGIIEQGRLVLDESVDDLKSHYRRVVLAFDGVPPAVFQPARGVWHVHAEGRMLSLLVSDHLDDVVALARQHQAVDIEISPVTLKDVFLATAGGKHEAPSATPRRPTLMEIR